MSVHINEERVNLNEEGKVTCKLDQISDHHFLLSPILLHTLDLQMMKRDRCIETAVVMTTTMMMMNPLTFPSH